MQTKTSKRTAWEHGTLITFEHRTWRQSSRFLQQQTETSERKKTREYGTPITFEYSITWRESSRCLQQNHKGANTSDWQSMNIKGSLGVDFVQNKKFKKCFWMKCITYNHQFLQDLTLHVFSFSIYRDRLSGKSPFRGLEMEKPWLFRCFNENYS